MGFYWACSCHRGRFFFHPKSRLARGVSLGFTGFYWVLLGFYVVLLGFTGFYLVVLGFIGVNAGLRGFYPVLLGFTEFYWVFTEVQCCL